MHILGISCYFHDAAAALLRDGELVAAVEEERFRRVGEGEKAGRLGGEEAGRRKTKAVSGREG
jgi:predicted NodU family carbamoyl transferase